VQGRVGERGKEAKGRGRKGGEGETRHTNPSLLPAPLIFDLESMSLCRFVLS